MKRATFGLCTGAILGVIGAANAGDLCKTVVYCDDFDTYEPGLLVGQDCVFLTNCGNNGDCPENGSWQGWDANPVWGQSLVVTDPNNSAPHSVSIVGPDDLIRTYGDLGLTSGVYQYSTDIFIPEDYTGESYFILLNTYTSSADANWSTQVHFAPSGAILSDFDDGVQNDVSYVKGEWKSLRIIMDLDEPGGTDDGQQIYYDDNLVVKKSWVDGVSGGGANALGAVDLFANGASVVYYDNIQICELSPLGACCFADSEGSCLDGQGSTECTDAGGVFQGFGSSCGGQCPILGPDGWEVEAPVTWGDTQGRNDTCGSASCEDIYEGDDIQLAVTIPWPSNWTFSTAGSELLDTELLLGTLGLCSDNLVDDGGCVGAGCAGDQDFEGNQAVFVLSDLGENDVVNVDVEEFSGECGKITLSVTGPCAQIVLPAGSDEGETCPLRENDGCNMDPGQEAFTPLALNETMRGKSRLTEAGTDRDTDWYEMTLDPGDYTIYQYGEFGGTGVGGLIQYNEGTEGSGNCDDISGFISPFGTFNRCSDYPAQGEMEIDFTITVPGTYWLFVGPAFGGADFNCDEDPGADYYLRVESAVDCVLPDQAGDADGSGCVEFDDLLIVLSNFDTAGPNGDVDCSGFVDFADILEVLSNWDKGCPGACCLPDDSCVPSGGRNDCEDMGGMYQGNGTTCKDVDCTK